MKFIISSQLQPIETAQMAILKQNQRKVTNPPLALTRRYRNTRMLEYESFILHPSALILLVQAS
jgi:hypothetical protein